MRYSVTTRSQSSRMAKGAGMVSAIVSLRGLGAGTGTSARTPGGTPRVRARSRGVALRRPAHPRGSRSTRGSPRSRRRAPRPRARGPDEAGVTRLDVAAKAGDRVTHARSPANLETEYGGVGGVDVHAAPSAEAVAPGATNGSRPGTCRYLMPMCSGSVGAGGGAGGTGVFETVGAAGAGRGGPEGLPFAGFTAGALAGGATGVGSPKRRRRGQHHGHGWRGGGRRQLDARSARHRWRGRLSARPVKNKTAPTIVPRASTPPSA